MEEKLIVAVCGHQVLYDTATHLRQMDKLRSWDVAPVVGVQAGDPGTDPSQQVLKLNSGQPEVPLEPVVIQTELLDKTVKFH